MSKRVIVIGGGPAGMMAAGTAASLGADVTLIEKNNILGKKLLITGKGRCNVTNFCDIENVLLNINSANPKFMYSALNEFSCYDAYAFFEELGVPLKIERGNRVFPDSDKAVDIRNAFKKYITKYSVNVINDTALSVKQNPLTVLTARNNYVADSVIIATGGLSYSSTGSTGDGYKFARSFSHKIVPTQPALVGVLSDKKICSNLMGLSLKNISISVLNDSGEKVYDDFGEMLFTHTGVSGPVILSASAKLDFTKNSYCLVIDLKPALSEKELDTRVLRDFEKYTNKDFINALSDLLPKKIIPQIVAVTGIDCRKKVNTITKEERQTLVQVIKNFTLPLYNKAGYDEAVITSGGVSTAEINPKTMESKFIKGLYFAGEVIDIDANTGGYNLQIAYSTGYLAGKSSVGGNL